MTENLTRLQAIKTAQNMHAGEWGIKAIRDYLASRGHDVCWETVKSWVDPEWARQRRAKHRATQRRAWRRRNGVKSFRVLDEDARTALASQLKAPVKAELSPDLLLALREDGLTYPAIAVVVRHVFGEELTAHQARYKLLKLGAEKNANKVRLATVDNPRHRQAA